MVNPARLLRRLLLAATALAALPPALAQTVLREGSEIAFTSRQMGVPVEGRFSDWQAELAFDPATPAKGRVAMTIATASATFGATETETEVRKPAWFDVAAFPRARFESSAIRAVGERRYEVAGRLTIKGRAQDLVVPVQLDGDIASGRFAIRRLAFGIGSGDWADTSLVADEVEVRFRLRLAGLAR